MRCFKDYVGLKYCSSETPESNYWINYEPGISLKVLDKIADAEQKSYAGVWDEVQERAIVKMEAKILNKLTSYIRTNTIQEVEGFGILADPINSLTPANQWQGVYIYSDLFKYNEAYLKSFDFYSTSVKTDAVFKLYNTWNGELLDTITTDLVIGFNTIKINYTAINNPLYFTRLFLCYDGSLIDSVDSRTQYKGAGWFGGSGTCWNTPQYYGSSYTYLTGAYSLDSGVDPTTNTLVTSSNTYGISLNYYIKCSLSAYICSVRELFKNAWVKLLAYEILQERITSTRLNFITVSDVEETKLQRDSFYKEFEESLGDTFENLRLPVDECFTCNSQFQHTYSRP